MTNSVFTLVSEDDIKKDLLAVWSEVPAFDPHDGGIPFSFLREFSERYSLEKSDKEIIAVWCQMPSKYRQKNRNPDHTVITLMQHDLGGYYRDLTVDAYSSAVEEIRASIKWITESELREKFVDHYNEYEEWTYVDGKQYSPSQLFKKLHPKKYEAALKDFAKRLAKKENFFVEGYTAPTKGE